MERVVERTAKAIRRAKKVKKVKLEQKARSEAWERNQVRVRLIRENTVLLRQDRKNRREDWERGRLAPRRDVGELTVNYGALNIYNTQLPERDPEGKVGWAPIRVDDRVVVVGGRDRGKIGVVKAVDYDRAAVQVTGLNTVDVHIPQWMKQQNNDHQALHHIEKFIHLEDVRLVFPLPDPETGAPRDVVIERLVHTPGGERAIAGTNTIIPYPHVEVPEPEYTDYDDDTLRISVEERTFRPFLIRAPMPLSVIDELRGKYSKFRTRHDYDYVQEKEAIDAKEEERKGLIKKMRTPLQELAELRERKKKEEERELTEEQLARIGEVIAQEQSKKYATA